MPTKEEEAMELARMHYEVESGLTHVFRINGPGEAESRPTEPVKLLEVNEFTVPSGIMPLRFGPSPASGLFFSCVIVDVTPDEYRKIQVGELKLPDGWTVGGLIPRPLAAVGG